MSINSLIFTQLWQVILSGFKNPINSLISEHHPLNKYKKKTNWIVFNIKQTRTILQPCRHIWVMVGDHTRTFIHTHILIHKQSFRERLDDGDFQYGLNVLLIISFSQVEKLDHMKPSTLLQSFRFYHCHQQFLPIFILTKQM